MLYSYNVKYTKKKKDEYIIKDHLYLNFMIFPLKTNDFYLS